MTNSGQLPAIALLPRHQRRVLGGHPWVFANEIAMTAEAKALPPGSLVRLMTDAGEAVGIAGFNPHALIVARMIDRNARAVIDAAWMTARLRRALKLRDTLFDTPHYRLIHAEADGLPGLVIDRYGDALSIQMNTALSEVLRPLLLEAVDAVLAPSVMVLRNDSTARLLEGLKQEVAVLRGDADRPVELVEYGVRFVADLAGGQKTGWFYDQRDNRHFVAGLARGARMLDLYSHTGGFALPAAVAGAQSVVVVDRSAPALALAERSAALNDVAARCSFVRAEAFAEMERLASAGERFDVVVADPPAFVKSKKDLGVGIKGYRKMIRMAAKLVTPGGYLCVASCSHNVTPEMFEEQLQRGLADARRGGRILRRAGAAPDHPLDPWLPESAYLKALVLQLD